MSVYTHMVEDIHLPDMIEVHQKFSGPRTADVEQAVKVELHRKGADQVIKPGMSVAITGGSRGICKIPVILKAVVAFCREQGAVPFIFPAMGSHGGGTAEGQKKVLESLGVTEAFCGCEIRATMEVTQISMTKEGHPVYMDAYAAEADAVIVVNRIKPHTAFRGPYESGLMKMMTIGMGKHTGASVCHRAGFGRMHHLIPLFGREVLKSGKIVLGLAVLENACDETCHVEALFPDEFETREPELLKQAYGLMGRLPFEQADVLIVDEIGKDYSGEGADPNISGAFPTPYATGGLQAERRVCLGLSKASHGCGYGCGLFDTISKRLYDQLDLDATYTNAITNTVLTAVRIPMMLPNDRDAIKTALRCCNHGDLAHPRIIRIANTAHIEKIYISEALVEEARKNPNLELVGKPKPFPFDERGNLTDF